MKATLSAAGPSDRDRHRAIHRSRYLRRRRYADGAAGIELRHTPDVVADLLARLEPFAHDAASAARAANQPEPYEAHLADGLIAMAHHATTPHTDATRSDSGADDTDTDDQAETGQGASGQGASGSASNANRGRRRWRTNIKVIVRIDYDALLRGWAEGDEVCEIDHNTGWCRTHTTELDDLAPLCHHHHWLKTYAGWRLEPGPGPRRLLPPEHSNHARGAAAANAP